MSILKPAKILGAGGGGGGGGGDVKSVNHIQPGPDGDITVPLFGLGLGPVAKTDAYSNIAQFYRVNKDSANKPAAVTGNVAAGVVCLPMDAAPSAGYLAVVGGNMAAYIGTSGAETGGITWARIYTDKFKPTLAELKALGNSGDQVLDGKLQLNHQLTIKAIEQTTADVIPMFFGPDDGVMDASIRASATTDNHGQLALAVRDDSGNVINALTIDGHSKAIMVQPGYKVYVGNSNVDISNITPFGGQVLGCQNAAELGALMGIFSAELLNKLKPENNANLGSTTVQGNVLPTTTTPYSILTVVNTWLTVPLTADELTLILKNRDKFIFEIGVGDRREANKSRFTVADNWHGADVATLKLTPDPYPATPYQIVLSFNGAAGNLSITDTHSGANQFGAIRSFTIRKVGAN